MAKKKAKSGKELFDEGEHGSSPSTDDIIPDVEITEALHFTLRGQIVSRAPLLARGAC